MLIWGKTQNERTADRSTTVSHLTKKGLHDIVFDSYRKWYDIIYNNTETIIILIWGRTQNERTADSSTALSHSTK